MSLYAFGLSGVWTGIGSAILPFKVIEVLEVSNVEILGYQLDKNGVLGLLSLAGLSIAAFIQLLAGNLSDREPRPGRRLPYLFIGAMGLAVATVLFGYAGTFTSLFLIVVGMQFFGNFGQGPANALIIDHVHPSRRGEAAGVLNLWRLLGAGIITVIVFQFMSRYDHVESPEWMWYSIILAVTVLVISALWTVLSLRPKRGTRVFLPRVTNGAATAAIRSVTEMTTQRVQITRNYLFFLIALAFAIAAMSSMQIYALFFLQDVVGLENPANGADQLVVIIAGSAGITVLPAGLMADRFGRDKLFFIAGTLGAISSALLLFVDSLGPVLLIGVLIGLAVGLLLTLTWVVANDLVSKQSAAKELGYTSIATLTGAALARFSGVGIDILNEVSENLGYQAILVSVSAAFIISSLLLSRVASNPSKAISGSDSPASLSAAN